MFIFDASLQIRISTIGERHADECGCYRMPIDTFDAATCINTYQILVILVSLDSPFQGLQNGTKIIKAWYVLIQLVASKVSIGIR